MIQIQKGSHNDYVVYDTSNFKMHHAHVKSYTIAKILKRNVENREIPKSKDIRLIESHIRVSTDKEYIRILTNLLRDLSKKKVSKHSLLGKVMSEKDGVIKRLEKDPTNEALQQVDRFYQMLILMIENSYHQPVHYTLNSNKLEIIYKSHKTKVTIVFNPDMESKISYLYQGNYTQKPFCRRNVKELSNTLQQVLDPK